MTRVRIYDCYVEIVETDHSEYKSLVGEKLRPKFITQVNGRDMYILEKRYKHPVLNEDIVKETRHLLPQGLYYVMEHLDYMDDYLDSITDLECDHGIGYAKFDILDISEYPSEPSLIEIDEFGNKGIPTNKVGFVGHLQSNVQIYVSGEDTEMASFANLNRRMKQEFQRFNSKVYDLFTTKKNLAAEEARANTIEQLKTSNYKENGGSGKGRVLVLQSKNFTIRKGNRGRGTRVRSRGSRTTIKRGHSCNEKGSICSEKTIGSSIRSTSTSESRYLERGRRSGSSPSGSNSSGRIKRKDVSKHIKSADDMHDAYMHVLSSKQDRILEAMQKTHDKYHRYQSDPYKRPKLKL